MQNTQAPYEYFNLTYQYFFNFVKMNIVKKTLFGILFIAIGYLLNYLIDTNNCYIEDRQQVIEINSNTRYQFGQDYTRSIYYFKLFKNRISNVNQASLLTDSIQKYEDNNLQLLWTQENNYTMFYKTGFQSFDEPGYIFTKDTLYSITLRPIMVKVVN